MAKVVFATAMPQDSVRTATDRNPGERPMARQLCRTSWDTASNHANTQASFACSFTWRTLPKPRREASSASAGWFPRCTSSSSPHRQMEREFVVEIALETSTTQQGDETTE